MRAIPKNRKSTFLAIEGYLKMGGDPNAPFVEKFCQEFQIDKKGLVEAISKGEVEWNGLKMKMERLGLL